MATDRVDAIVNLSKRRGFVMSASMTTIRLGTRGSPLALIQAGMVRDALVAAVREIGARVAVATPALDTLFGLTRLFGRVRGLYPEAQA